MSEEFVIDGVCEDGRVCAVSKCYNIAKYFGGFPSVDISFPICEKCLETITPEVPLKFGATSFGNTLLKQLTGIDGNDTYKNDDNNYIMKFFNIEKELNPKGNEQISKLLDDIIINIAKDFDLQDVISFQLLLEIFQEIENEEQEAIQQYCLRVAYANLPEPVREFVKYIYDKIIEKWSVNHTEC